MEVRRYQSGEIFQALRFAVVGVFTALLFIGVVAAFENFHESVWWSTPAAYIVAITFQYLGHSLFTYAKPLLRLSQTARFLLVNGVGLGVSVCVVDYVFPILGWPRWIGASTLILILPVLNLFLFRFWVFNDRT